MAGLLVFGVLLLVGFIALIVVKVKWARQANRKMATSASGENVPK